MITKILIKAGHSLFSCEEVRLPQVVALIGNGTKGVTYDWIANFMCFHLTWYWYQQGHLSPVRGACPAGQWGPPLSSCMSSVQTWHTQQNHHSSLPALSVLSTTKNKYIFNFRFVYSKVSSNCYSSQLILIKDLKHRKWKQGTPFFFYIFLGNYVTFLERF